MLDGHVCQLRQGDTARPKELHALLHEAEPYSQGVILLFSEAVVGGDKPSLATSQNQCYTDHARQRHYVWRERWLRALEGTRSTRRTSGVRETGAMMVRPRGIVLQKLQQQAFAAICCL